MPRSTDRRFAPLLTFLAALVLAPPALADAPKGTVTKYSFTGSKVFPGTTRDYFVYVPQQYDGSKPACVYVNQDGVQYKAPEVFDRLIDAKEMPVTIGVFVTPGTVRATGTDTPGARVNRSFEYDSLGDGYARFLLDELLPEVETKTTADGKPIRLSKDGNDRAIGGASSGAIAAFNVAWERPDAFRRVFSSIGTYVDLRGGDRIPTLIRKTEPKPIRIFLEDGSGDLNNPFGDWWMANQTMERAFQFAGYEVAHAWGTGGHNGTHATEVFPEAVKFLWKDYPEPVRAGKGSNEMRAVLKEGEDWQLVGEGYNFTEGPTAGPDGSLYFSDIPESKIRKVALDGTVSVVVADSKRANGLQFGPDGRLYTLATGTSELISYAADGSDPKMVASGFRGNDLVVLKSGAIYATYPGVPTPSPDRSRLVYVSPTGEVKTVDTGLTYANGVAISPDQNFLFATDMRSHWIYSYRIEADGSLTDKQRYVHVHVPDTADDSSADGLRFDRDGRMYIATRMGVQVADREGRVNAIIPTPNGRCSNIGFAGPDMDVLYVAAGDKVYKRAVKPHGTRPEVGPIKVPAR